MRSNRRGLVLGVVALGVAGALATGVGVAWADPSIPPGASASARYHGGMYAMMAGQRVCLSAAAAYLGLSEADLLAQLHSGRTLADIARSQGKSEAGLKDAMIAAARQAIESDTSLTAEQKTAALERVESRVEAMITRVHGPGAGGGMMGGPGGAGGPGRGSGQGRCPHGA